MATHPSRFALVFEGFLSVLRRRLDVIDGVLYVVLDTIDHLTLCDPAGGNHMLIIPGSFGKGLIMRMEELFSHRQYSFYNK